MGLNTLRVIVTEIERSSIVYHLPGCHHPFRSSANISWQPSKAYFRCFELADRTMGSLSNILPRTPAGPLGIGATPHASAGTKSLTLTPQKPAWYIANWFAANS